MNMEEFLMDHPWAADVAKSPLLLALLRYVEEPKTMEEIHKTFYQLSEDDVARALYVLKTLKIIDGDGERVWLSEDGKTFLKVYDETF